MQCGHSSRHTALSGEQTLEDVCAPLLITDTGLLEIFSYIELVEFTAVESVDKRTSI